MPGIVFPVCTWMLRSERSPMVHGTGLYHVQNATMHTWGQPFPCSCVNAVRVSVSTSKGLHHNKTPSPAIHTAPQHMAGGMIYCSGLESRRRLPIEKKLPLPLLRGFPFCFSAIRYFLPVLHRSPGWPPTLQRRGLLDDNSRLLLRCRLAFNEHRRKRLEQKRKAV